jgi:DivIVA domain-containing protein
MEPALTPEEIRGADFSITFRGYDRGQVAAFLQDVAAEVEVLRDSTQKSYLTVGEELGELLQHSKDIADKLLLDAQSEAATLVENAAAEATELRESAEVYAKQLREQVDSEAADSRSKANKEYAERIRSADSRVKELGVEENQARQRISALRTELEEVAKSLLQAGTNGSRSAEPPQDEEKQTINLDSEQTDELDPEQTDELDDLDRDEPIRASAVAAPPLGTTQISSQDDGGMGSGITWLKQHL